jgi:hypothetical protein
MNPGRFTLTMPQRGLSNQYMKEGCSGAFAQVKTQNWHARVGK